MTAQPKCENCGQNYEFHMWRQRGAKQGACTVVQTQGISVYSPVDAREDVTVPVTFESPVDAVADQPRPKKGPCRHSSKLRDRQTNFLTGQIDLCCPKCGEVADYPKLRRKK